MLCSLVLKRSPVMQLNLIFPGTREPHEELWTALDEKTRRAALERLAEIIAKAAPKTPRAESNDHD